MCFSKLPCLLIFFLSYTYCKTLESIDETDFLHMIKGEKGVIVLFSKPNCEKCDAYETVLENIQDDLKDSLNVDVAKITNSPMVKLYDPTKEPALLFFRKGIPLLYSGPLSEDEILQTFSDNRDPIVKELSDTNFEHLTQASTGATTGDWLIFFYSSDCISCQRLYAIWEAVAAHLKRRMNVARVNRKDSGISTAKRFNVEKSPDFLLIQQGKFYRYKSNDHSPESFIKFAEISYKKVSSAENVPPVVNPISDVVALLKNIIAEYPSIIISLGLGLTIISTYCAKMVAKKKSKTDKTK